MKRIPETSYFALAITRKLMLPVLLFVAGIVYANPLEERKLNPEAFQIITIKILENSAGTVYSTLLLDTETGNTWRYIAPTREESDVWVPVRKQPYVVAQIGYMAELGYMSKGNPQTERVIFTGLIEDEKEKHSKERMKKPGDK